MKKLMALGLASMMLLCGCSGDTEPKTTVCKGSDGDTTFVSEGDKVITQTEVYTTTLADFITENELPAELAESEEAASLIEEMYDAVFEDGGITKGVETTVELSESGELKITIVVDYTKADLKELEAAELVDDVDSDYISLKATIENFESMGDTCE